jgi:ribosome-associated translation inhibitor RaiA
MTYRIVGKDVAIGERWKQRIERRLEFALCRFGAAIQSVDLTLEDENGPRGGVDKNCRIVVKMRRGEDVVVKGRGDDALGLVDRTADRAGRAVARALDLRRRRTGARASGHVRGRRS